jgi:hypothetical protein
VDFTEKLLDDLVAGDRDRAEFLHFQPAGDVGQLPPPLPSPPRPPG